MKLAFVYAGQGSQKVGMGRDFYDRYPEFRAVYDGAPVDFDLKELSFEGPEETLSRTRYTQPCMVAFAIGVTDLLVRINRQAFTVKYASEVADRYRSQLRNVSTLGSLETLLDSLDLEDGFLAYLSREGVDVDMKQWNESRDVVLTQLRALVGRYSPMDDNAFYPLLARIDNVIQTAVND